MSLHAPDLKAPRFRKSKEGSLNKEFINTLRKNVKSAKDLTDDEIKNIILTFNGNVWKNIIEKRDGVDLPEQLGHIFVGTCKPRKNKITDFVATIKYNKPIQHKNWESDQHLAKIFYTNHISKYKFRNFELWGFNAVRQFKRTLSKEYPYRWKQYIQVEPNLKISCLYNENFKYRVKEKKIETIDINTYNEFDI
jgi:hypothetical protein